MNTDLIALALRYADIPKFASVEEAKLIAATADAIRLAIRKVFTDNEPCFDGARFSRIANPLYPLEDETAPPRNVRNAGGNKLRGQLPRPYAEKEGEVTDKPTKRVRNLMTGKEIEIPADTPASCDPSTERYWSM